MELMSMNKMKGGMVRMVVAMVVWSGSNKLITSALFIERGEPSLLILI